MNMEKEIIREKIIDAKRKALKLVKINETDQTKDLRVPTNFDGYGRIKHFSTERKADWPVNIIHIKDACQKLNLPYKNEIKGQVFQLSGCDYRCWYCFVPEESLIPKEQISDWVTVENMVSSFVETYKQGDISPIMLLSGGNPALVPEWVLWTIEEFKKRGIEKDIILWSEDNLSSDYFFDKLNQNQITEISNYSNYGRFCCLKGYNEESFSFNTKVKSDEFEKQFVRLERLYKTGINVYVYVTMTTPNINNVEADMKSFFDRLQRIDERLPLKVIPVKIKEYSITKEKIERTESVTEREKMYQSLYNQKIIAETFINELKNRFPIEEIEEKILLYK